MCMKNVILQDTVYALTEWDGSTTFARVVSDGPVVSRRVDGTPMYRRPEKNVRLVYEDGLVHQVSPAHFYGLNPRVGVQLQDLYS